MAPGYCNLRSEHQHMVCIPYPILVPNYGTICRCTWRIFNSGILMNSNVWSHFRKAATSCQLNMDKNSCEAEVRPFFFLLQFYMTICVICGVLYAVCSCLVCTGVNTTHLALVNIPCYGNIVLNNCKNLWWSSSIVDLNINIYVQASALGVYRNTLVPKQNGRHFLDDISKGIYWMKTHTFRLRFHWSLFKDPINNISALVQIMTWRRPGNKPLSEPMMVNVLTHICITRPQWVKNVNSKLYLSSSHTLTLYRLFI